mgnify:CR=1 FL=1
MSHYKTLDLDTNCSQQEIKRAYKKLAMKWHPDKNQDKDLANEKIKEINEAYSILSDVRKRQQYDNPVPILSFPSSMSQNIGMPINIVNIINRSRQHINQVVEKQVEIHNNRDSQIQIITEKSGNQTVKTTITKNLKTGNTTTERQVNISF